MANKRYTLKSIPGNPENTDLARHINLRDLLEIVSFQLGEIGHDGIASRVDECVEALNGWIEVWVEPVGKWGEGEGREESAMTEYTPGPWYVTGSSPDGLVFAEGKRGPIVPHWDQREWTPAEQMANAHLIAAAPELLAALLDLVCCPAFTGACFENDPESHKAWTLARAVIAKARRAAGE